MDLKNGKITVKEITAHPGAMELFEREFGDMAHHPMVKAASSMKLSQVIKLAKKHIDAERIKRILNELEEL